MSKSNLIIDDSEFVFAEKIILTYIAKLMEYGNQYITILDELTLDIEASNIISGLMGLKQEVSDTLTDLEYASDCLKGKTKKFIADIDRADQFIY